MKEYTNAVLELERSTSRVFGSTFGAYPLLLSIRSGSKPFSVLPTVTGNELACMSAGELLIRGKNLIQYATVGIIINNLQLYYYAGCPESLQMPGVHESIQGIGMNDQVAS